VALERECDREERIERESSEDMVLRNDESVVVDVDVVEIAVSGGVICRYPVPVSLPVPSRPPRPPLEEIDCPPRSRSQRRSCKPVRIGSFPFDLIDSENDLPGDLRGGAGASSGGIMLESGGGGVVGRGPG
jgi:hypothetical protein